MTTSAQHLKNRTRKDIIIRRCVTFFGISVLATLLVLVWHLISQTLPLFINPSLEHQQTYNFEFSELVSSGDLLDGEPLIVKNDSCGLSFINVANQNAIDDTVTRPCSNTLKIVEESDKRWLIDISGSGLVRANKLDVQGVYSARLDQETGATFALSEEHWRNQLDFDIALSPPILAVAVTDDQNHHIYWHNQEQVTNTKVTTTSITKDILILPILKSVLVYEDNQFAVMNDDGEILSTYSTQLPINWISTIEQNRSIYIAYGSKQLSRWVMHNDSGKFVFSQSYTLELNDNESPLTIQAHADSNAAILLTNRNRIILLNRVTGEMLHSTQLDSPPLNISWFGDRVYLVFPNRIDMFSLVNAAGMNTFKALFEPTWYEGYSNPEHIYQTSSGSDFREAKYGLVPLLIGSVKAAFSALFIAVPLAISGAIYTGFFANARWRNRVKPVVEMLEAVPSVVIGFIAAILLVPLAGELIITFAIFVFTAPLIIFSAVILKPIIQQRLSTSAGSGSEMLFIMIGILVWVTACYAGASFFNEGQLLAGFSKTTLVVSMALGLAISPTIYTLADDAIFSVPTSLKNASFALGATQLQTLKSIVVRVAMPGLVAATMLGFGRAVGETMIVLMVTGNTPIPEWSLFESLRALTANIAIELPEAEVGSALYTVLFFTASSLFVFTFVFNTIAEGLRHRMRQQVKYV